MVFLYLFCMVDDSYEVQRNSECYNAESSPHYNKTIKTFSEAKRLCTNDPSCVMISGDAREYQDFKLCDDNAEIYHGSETTRNFHYNIHDIIYVKKSKYLIFLILEYVNYFTTRYY